ncbi:MAG: hypothetical protein QM708_06935 [Propioniciclava sp.]|uniref:hypothetical protein n=1 Tax=Propioniciclava sp. TaxID=2038686 RepID=UPI0039E3CC4B
MLTRLFAAWPYALILAALYLLLPWAHEGIARATNADAYYLTGVIISYLFFFNPGLTFLASAVAGYRHGFAWVLIPLNALAMLPVSLVFYRDIEGMLYALPYAVFTVLGLLSGWGLHTFLVRRGSIA